MNKQVSIIDIPEIQKYVKTKHRKFLKDVGIFSRKIAVDHQLHLTRLVAKISRVIECFVEEKVIDEFIPYSLPYADGEYVRAFSLRKKDFSESVYLWTDGKLVVLGDSRLPITNADYEVIRNIDLDKFDGVAFAKTLLDYIHKKIYSRRESYEQRVFGIDFSSEQKEDAKTE